MPHGTVLVVDPDKNIAETTALAISIEGEFVAVGMTSLDEAYRFLTGCCPDLVVLAAIFPNVSKLEHAIKVREKYGCKVLLVSAYSEAAKELDYIRSQGHEAFEILAKPVHPTELVNKIRAILRNSQHV